VTRFQFVADHRHAFEVKRLCSTVEVSRSSFYAWEGGAQARAARAEIDEHNIHSARSNRRGSFRVVCKVSFGHPIDISGVVNGASHNNKLADMRRKITIAQDRERDVCKRRNGNHCNLARLLPHAPAECTSNYHMFYVLLPDRAARDGLIALGRLP